jgi:hypothetical protein
MGLRIFLDIFLFNSSLDKSGFFKGIIDTTSADTRLKFVKVDMIKDINNNIFSIIF